MAGKSRVKKLLVLLVVVVIAGLIIPVSNLIVGMPKSERLVSVKTDDPLMAEACKILGTKCANCHTDDTEYPFYAALPVAKSLVQKDVKTGRQYLEMASALTAADVPAEVVLAKIEYASEYGTMPPKRYLALHWNGGLSASEKATLKKWIVATRAANYATAGLPRKLQEMVIMPLPEAHSEDAAKVALGKQLYHDKRLSGDDTISCASCHDLDKGGTDQAAVATGVAGAKGPINSPTVYNSVFNVKQFWDGRAEDLKDQAGGPVENPIEMAAKFDDVVAKLNEDQDFKTAFEKVYPAGISKDTITDAIATYEKTLITPNCAFDKYLKGDKSALTAEEIAGYDQFLDLGCAMCHCGEAMGGQSFELMGRKGDYFKTRGDVKEVDNGRFNHTKQEADKHKFKVPTLRNVAKTHPYFHDASAKDLAKAVQIMAKYQVGDVPTDAEIRQIVAFLNTLTGEYEGQILK